VVSDHNYPFVKVNKENFFIILKIHRRQTKEGSSTAKYKRNLLIDDRLLLLSIVHRLLLDIIEWLLRYVANDLEDTSKENQGGLKHRKVQKKSVQAYGNIQHPDRCIVKLYEKYISKCPGSDKCDAFYLRPLNFPCSLSRKDSCDRSPRRRLRCSSPPRNAKFNPMR
jgi:hypothetical protein